MRKIQKKKMNEQGSVLVIALLFFVVLTIITAMVSNTVFMAVKSRTMEKNQVETLYRAESGLTLAQIALEKTFTSAVSVAQSKATSQQTFDQAMVEFIGNNRENKWTQAATTLSYYNENHSTTAVTTKPPALELAIIDSNVYDEANKTWQFILSSAFQDSTNISRKVSVDIHIKIPEWQAGPQTAPLLEQNMITTDSSIDIQQSLNGGGLTFDGNIYANGEKDEPTATESNSSEYESGIRVSSLSNEPILFNQMLTTANSVVSKDKAVLIGQDVYAKNVVVQNDTSNTFDNITTGNDFVLNASSGLTTIGNYYGISDVNVDSTTTKMESSSIISNPPSANSSAGLTITDSAYIAGTAFINLSSPYQTGESVAVNGNYHVYTLPVQDIQEVCTKVDRVESCQQIVYEYIEPLQVIVGTKLTPISDLVSWTVEQKSQYFSGIASKLKNTENELKHGNIQLPQNTYAAGAIVRKTADNKTEVLTPKFGSEQLAVLKEAQNTYAKAAYYLNLPFSDQWIEPTELDWNSIYTNGKTMTIQDFIHFDKGTEVQSENFVYNKDKNKAVVITNETCSVNEICLKPDNKGETPFLVITAGDIIVRDIESATITGTVVAQGNVMLKDTVNQLTWNKGDIIDIMSTYAEQLTGVFHDLPNWNESMSDAMYKPKEYVELKNWQLLY